MALHALDASIDDEYWQLSDIKGRYRMRINHHKRLMRGGLPTDLDFHPAADALLLALWWYTSNLSEIRPLVRELHVHCCLLVVCSDD